MRESAMAALSLLRSRAEVWKIDPKELRDTDLHIHVPAGAVPKDGPSAGVAMLTALFTLFTGSIADPSVGMTGEITLRGLVLPIGGVKEKVLAAHRAGLKTVVLPARNEPDLHEVSKEVREQLRFVLAKRVEDVLLAAVPGVRIVREAGEEKPRSRPARKTRKTRAALAARGRRPRD